MQLSVADAITSKVSKGEMGSYITQYYNNVIIAFNKNSKYVQINPGEIAIYNYGVENSKKRAVFDETGNHFYGWFKNSNLHQFMEKYGIEELQKYCKRRLSYLSKRNRAKEALAC